MGTEAPCTCAELADEKERFKAQQVETAKSVESLNDLIGFNSTSPVASRALGKELKRCPGVRPLRSFDRH